MSKTIGRKVGLLVIICGIIMALMCVANIAAFQVLADYVDRLEESVEAYGKACAADDVTTQISSSKEFRGIFDKTDTKVSGTIIFNFILVGASVVVIGLIMFIVNKTVAGPARKASKDLGTILNEIENGEGDLTKRLDVKTKDEVGQLVVGFNSFIEQLHDIPNTVKKSMSVLSKLDVDMTNLHAAGTISMMEAALEGLTREDGTRPLLIAVTQLTSTDQERMENDLLIKEPIDKVVMHYASNAAKAGLDGVVCSPLEAGKVHDTCGAKFLTVTPGVRFADGDIGDQKRVMTPAEAKKIGSDYIVVGRPITAAADPVAAYERCVAEFVD